MRLALAAVLLAASLKAQVPSAWTTPQNPFRIAGNLYYVGSRDLAAYLINTPAGNILINQNLATSPPRIRHSIEQLGFRYADTKILLNSQAHYDHAAGLAEIARETHALVEVMDADVPAIQAGDQHDFGGPELLPYAPTPVDRILHDGEQITLGGTTLTALKTPGHTPGCTTFTLQLKEGPRTLTAVIVGGVSALSTHHLTPPESYPGITTDFEQTFRILAALPADIFLGAHGQYFNMQPKLARLPKEGLAVWIDPRGYQTFIAQSLAAFKSKLAQEEAVGASGH